jgi:hypothetical protein
MWKFDWCVVSVDGRLARCQRVEAGAWKSGTDKSGQTYHLHRFDGTGPYLAAAPPSRISVASARLASADDLYGVYTAMLALLVLSQLHRENLRERGLPDAEIDRRLYRSLAVQGRARLARELGERFGAELLLSVLGFSVKDKDGRKYISIAGAAGLLVPVRDLAGCIIALKVRRMMLATARVTAICPAQDTAAPAPVRRFTSPSVSRRAP